ncbi:Tropomyosin [uncultured Gammaproteobacteria bacterium]
MDVYESALDRLGKAVARLETAVEQRESRLSAERANLVQALQDARAEQARAEGVAETVTARLDVVIERLNAVLET